MPAGEPVVWVEHHRSAQQPRLVFGYVAQQRERLWTGAHNGKVHVIHNLHGTP